MRDAHRVPLVIWFAELGAKNSLAGLKINKLAAVAKNPFVLAAPSRDPKKGATGRRARLEFSREKALRAARVKGQGA